MKKIFFNHFRLCRFFVTTAFVCAFVAGFLWGGRASGQEHERILEKVTVTNIEVPVRVLYKGKPVKDLTFNENLTNAVDYVFEKILRKNDRLLVFANEKTLEYPEIGEKQIYKIEIITAIQRRKTQITVTKKSAIICVNLRRKNKEYDDES